MKVKQNSEKIPCSDIPIFLESFRSLSTDLDILLHHRVSYSDPIPVHKTISASPRHGDAIT